MAYSATTVTRICSIGNGATLFFEYQADTAANLKAATAARLTEMKENDLVIYRASDDAGLASVGNDGALTDVTT